MNFFSRNPPKLFYLDEFSVSTRLDHVGGKNGQPE